MAEHPSVIGAITSPGKHRNRSPLPAASFKAPIRCENNVIARRNAEDGSRRLAVAICQYHVKHTKSLDRSLLWSKRAKELSFGS